MAATTLTNQFREALEQLDFKYNKSGNTGLLFINDLNKRNLSPKEVFGLEVASTYRADAVYFRKFEDNRPAIPQIYIYDNTREKFHDTDYAEIQRHLWSACVVPLFIIVEKSRVLIFDSRKPVDIFFNEISADPIEIIQITSKALKEYSAKYFDNGTFWEKEKSADKFLERTSAYNDLIDGLKRIRRSFLNNSDLPENTAHKLLVLSILVKYLEERGDDGETLFAKNFFRQFGADDFCGVLRNKGQVINLFAKLGNHFNGKIFAWDDKHEVELLRNCDLTELANFLDANIENNQYVLWRRYSFNHLPVELISSVYEEFLGKEKKDVVYTPHILVNTLIDECMPLSQPQIGIKLIDVSCGSGIFLVAAYKRLVEWWRYKEYLETGILPSNPSLQVLKKILKDSIFGVDIEADATRLTIFSLALALCDSLSPKQIWTELKFDDLNAENIVTSDFFIQLSKLSKNFDLVIGNPPFIEFDKDQFKEIISSNNLNISCKIPQNQIALLFLDQAMSLLKPKGILCLIMPSGPLLYNDTLYFRKYFFEKYCIPQILDFTNLSNTLFGANVATSALFVVNNKPNFEDYILHITIRRTKAAKEKIFFELDHYDFHKVDYLESVTEKFIWKANLFGGKRVAQIIKRLSQQRTFITFLEEKKDNNGWDFGQGYIVGEKNRKHTAKYITGHQTIIDRYFTESGIGKTEIQKEIYFKDKSKEAIFQPPHLLIKKSIGVNNIPVTFSNKYITFRNEVIGISAPVGNEKQLKEIQNFFLAHNILLRFYISTTSARSGISRSTFTLLQEDIMNLPYPEDFDELKLSFAEKLIVDDVVNYSLDQISKGENSKVNIKVQDKQLKQFSSVFCKALNSVYEDNNKKFKLHSLIDCPTFNALLFVYTSRDIGEVKNLTSSKIESDIEALVLSQTGKNLRINRAIRIYMKDKIYLIKPKQLRYWLKSIALRDADETLSDLIKAGY